MDRQSPFAIPILVACGVSAVSVLLIGLVLAPSEGPTWGHWMRVGWTEALVFLVWGGWFGYIVPGARINSGGVLGGGVGPAMAVLVSGYALLSFLMMVVHALLPEGDLLWRIHMILQIAAFAVTAVLGAMLFVAKAGSGTRV